MKKAKFRAKLILLALLMLTAAITFVGATGIPALGIPAWLPTTDAAAWPEALALGLDLRGGVYVEYEAEQPEDGADFEHLMESSIAVIGARLTDKGYSEATVRRLGDTGIRVEIPDVTDPSAVLDLIGSPAQLEFRTPSGETFMTGDMVASAEPAVSQDPNSLGQYVIQLKLNKDGTELFRDMTTQYVGQVLYILLDGEVLLAPVVNEPIPNGACTISGMDGYEETAKISAQIQSGAIPLVLSQQKVDTVSATLGDDALTTSVLAGLVGLGLVMLLMILRYRMNGVVASWALVIYIVLLFLLMAVIPTVQLTLPGLAGIVLGIGMAVDANVVIFERFNEEVRAGRSLKAAVRTGFKNASRAVLDSNITTLIAAFVLFIFGTGSIQGFGVALGLSVITSMFTAITVTRLLMKNLVACRKWPAAAFTSGEIKTEGEVE